MMGYILAVLVVVAAYMVWYLWKWFFYPVCSGSYLKLTSANPDKWYIVKRTYGDGSVRFKVGGANIAKFRDASCMDYQVNGRDALLHCQLDVDHRSFEDVEDLIGRCKAAYVAYQQKVANAKVVKEEVV